MNCSRTRSMLDAYVDRELDQTTRLELSEHLATCPACARQLAERDRLAQQVRAGAPRYLAPPALKRRIERLAHTNSLQSRPRPAGPTWLQAAAVVLIVAMLSVVLGYVAGRPSQEDSLSEEIVANHATALADARRLVEVVSTDRHVVKPWLQGKVDFAPSVRDLSAQNYILLGARLERIRGHRAVSIVYRVRNHTINLYAWRAREVESEAPVADQARGFSLVTWVESGLRYAAIADIEARELSEFAALMRTATRDPE